MYDEKKPEVTDFLVMSIIQKRQKSVWLWPDFIFKLTADGQKYERGLKHLHDFTRNVIKQRWNDYQQKKQELGENFEAEYFGEAKSARKHRLSFLGRPQFGFMKIKMHRIIEIKHT